MKIEQIDNSHVAKYSNVNSEHIGLWCYFDEDRAYGFCSTKDIALQAACSSFPFGIK